MLDVNIVALGKLQLRASYGSIDDNKSQAFVLGSTFRVYLFALRGIVFRCMSTSDERNQVHHA